MAGKAATRAIPTIIERLNKARPNARYELNYENPFQLLVATILAAQATDERINQVTPALFAKYPDAAAFARADRAELEQDLKPTGFYRNKAKAVQECCQALVERFGGEVPPRMEDLVALPGVARKTANVVLNNAFRIASGVIVDTHVARVSQRMGLSGQKKAEKIEQDLMRLIPKDEWVQFGTALVLHGRYVCTSADPKCGECIFNDLCPKIGVEATAASAPKGRRIVAPGGAQRNPGASAAQRNPGASAAQRNSGTGGTALAEQLPADWCAVLADELAKPYFRKLAEFVGREREEHAVFPPEEDVFNAFRHTPFDKVKVLLLGQDPYHDDGQAHGLCFSVRSGTKPPPSLVNIFKELHDDLGCTIPDNGDLTAWADRGVMLLNAMLTVRAHSPGSHANQGWETFTDAVIRALSARDKPLVFLLWGAYAQKKAELIDREKHAVLMAAHPSPLSAKKFFGSKPFSKANAALKQIGEEPIDWQLPNLNEIVEAPRPAQTPRPEPTVVVAAPPPPTPAPAPNGLAAHLPADWRKVLAGEFDKPHFRKLEKFLDAERQEHAVYPDEGKVFAAFALTPFDQVRVVVLGDEPPARKGQADGLAWSVPPGWEPTRELRRVFQESRTDLGCRIPETGCLATWAERGVLLLNEVLTVRGGEPGSHADRGWEKFTNAVVAALSAREKPVVFLFVGDAGTGKERLIDAERHGLVRVPEPEDEDFVGSRPFSAVNDALERRGQPAVYWQIYAV
jgi:uracil-DNA glycosylase